MARADEYRDALKTYLAARAEVADLVRILKAVAQQLDCPEGFQFKNSDEYLPLGTPVSNIEVLDWPSAKQIQQRISNWHDKYWAVNRAWRALPRDEQSKLPRPPSSIEP
jgi:isopenicillin N synthase-like dioxygenase